jgi:hypothetical protein
MAKAPPITPPPSTDMGEVILHQAQRIVDLVERRAAGHGLRIGTGSVSILLHALALKAAHAAGPGMDPDKLKEGAASLAENLQSAMASYHAQFVQHQQLLDAAPPTTGKVN